MSNPTGPAHRSVASIRQSITPSAATGPPGAPHTPLRTIVSSYGSPSTLRAEEELVIVEIGSRYLKAGFAGDAVPKAVVDFGPEEQRRPGDYRRWEVGYDKKWRDRIQGKGWSEQHELWRPDLRGLDLGFVGDKIERAMRDVYTKYLLIDSRPRRITVVLPSALPLPLLSVVLDTLFTYFQPPTISLLSGPVLSTVAAGVRAALVVDIGWAETTVTAVYEFREVQSLRSIRASKLLVQEMYKILAEELHPDILQKDSLEMSGEIEAPYVLSFEECEDIMARLAWCQPAQKKQSSDVGRGLTPVKEESELRSSMRSMNLDPADPDPMVSVPVRSSTPPKTLHIPFSKLAVPCENALFASGRSYRELDDEELPLHELVYRSLLRLPLDVRTLCMSRVIFVGGGSNTIGLKSRILNEVQEIIDTRGWDGVIGKAVEQFHSNPKLRSNRPKQATVGPTEVGRAEDANTPKVIAGLAEQEPDPIGDLLTRETRRGNPEPEHGFLRAIDSLGSWSGASLLSQLKAPSVSIIDREQWAQHGIAGASRSIEVSAATQRQSLGPGAFKAGAADRSSWTLGLWA
ncbi:hypothetical protein F5884DRAFT_33832 [Xylogone sp. PMI_703]|nr:hypothetical protein F5884DRAFT_33832 [Xylogone sp. PMI_703]